MGLLDWVRGGKRADEPGPGDSVEERADARREQAPTTSEVTPESAQPEADPAGEDTGRQAGR